MAIQWPYNLRQYVMKKFSKYFVNGGTQEILLKILNYSISMGVHGNEKKSVKKFF